MWQRNICGVESLEDAVRAGRDEAFRAAFARPADQDRWATVGMLRHVTEKSRVFAASVSKDGRTPRMRSASRAGTSGPK